MTYRIIWLPEAMNAYARLKEADPDGARQVAAAVRALAAEPAPPGSSTLGGTGYRRLRLGAYRVLYEVEGTTVSVLHVGGLPPRR